MVQFIQDSTLGKKIPDINEIRIGSIFSVDSHSCVACHHAVVCSSWEALQNVQQLVHILWDPPPTTIVRLEVAFRTCRQNTTFSIL